MELLQAHADFGVGSLGADHGRQCFSNLFDYRISGVTVPYFLEHILREYHQTWVFTSRLLTVEEARPADVLAASGQGPMCFLSHLYLRTISRVGLSPVDSGQGYQGCNVTLEKSQVKLPTPR